MHVERSLFDFAVQNYNELCFIVLFVIILIDQKIRLTSACPVNIELLPFSLYICFTVLALVSTYSRNFIRKPPM